MLFCAYDGMNDDDSKVQGKGKGDRICLDFVYVKKHALLTGYIILVLKCLDIHSTLLFDMNFNNTFIDDAGQNGDIDGCALPSRLLMTAVFTFRR